MQDEIRREIAALVPRLRRFAGALAGNMDDGDDIVQTACLKALSGLDRFTPGTRLDSWMFRIVQNTFLDTVRSRRRWRTVGDPDLLESRSDGGQGARRAEDRLVIAELRDAVAALPDDQRAVLALVAIDGLSYKEAAAALDIPIGTVMSRLARAREKLLYLASGERP
jgi:RNA polymerase sigma-70 factor (ECF subfamily)